MQLRLRLEAKEGAAAVMVVAAAAQPALDIIWRISAEGNLRNAPRPYVAALVEAMATTTMDAMSDDPEHAASICADGFEALWRLLN